MAEAWRRSEGRGDGLGGGALGLICVLGGSADHREAYGGHASLSQSLEHLNKYRKKNHYSVEVRKYINR